MGTREKLQGTRPRQDTPKTPKLSKVVDRISVLSTVQLRPARAADVDFLYRLHKAAMQDYVAQTWGWDEAWQQQYFYQHFDPSVCQIIVAAGYDVGVLSVVRQAEVVYLRNVAVLPPYQGRGIGTSTPVWASP